MQVQNLISIVSKIINDKSSIVSINLLIKNNWNKIFSTDILRFADFEKAIFFKTDQATVLNVFINVIGSAIIFIKTKTETIKKSLQSLTGINEINVILHQALRLSAVKQKDIQHL